MRASRKPYVHHGIHQVAKERHQDDVRESLLLDPMLQRPFRADVHGHVGRDRRPVDAPESHAAKPHDVAMGQRKQRVDFREQGLLHHARHGSRVHEAVHAWVLQHKKLLHRHAHLAAGKGGCSWKYRAESPVSQRLTLVVHGEAPAPRVAKGTSVSAAVGAPTRVAVEHHANCHCCVGVRVGQCQRRVRRHLHGVDDAQAGPVDDGAISSIGVLQRPPSVREHQRRRQRQPKAVHEAAPGDSRRRRDGDLDGDLLVGFFATPSPRELHSQRYHRRC